MRLDEQVQGWPHRPETHTGRVKAPLTGVLTQRSGMKATCVPRIRRECWASGQAIRSIAAACETEQATLGTVALRGVPYYDLPTILSSARCARWIGPSVVPWPSKIGLFRGFGIVSLFSARRSIGALDYELRDRAVWLGANAPWISHEARRYDEELVCGRYVITTSLDASEVGCAKVLRHYRSLQNVEARFRISKDSLALRPVFHWTEDRVRGQIALCILEATIEAVMAKDLAAAKAMDPDLAFQHMTPRRALAERAEVRLELVSAGERAIELVSRPTPLQAKVLRALGVDTSGWGKATIA